VTDELYSDSITELEEETVEPEVEEEELIPITEVLPPLPLQNEAVLGESEIRFAEDIMPASDKGPRSGKKKKRKSNFRRR
jgi:hypothetical protein